MINLIIHSQRNLWNSWIMSALEWAVKIKTCKYRVYLDNFSARHTIIWILKLWTISDTWRYRLKYLVNFWKRLFPIFQIPLFNREERSRTWVLLISTYSGFLFSSERILSGTLGSFIFDLIIVRFILYIYRLICILLTFSEGNTSFMYKFIFFMLLNCSYVLICIF